MDCLNCKFEDCINDYVRPIHSKRTEKEIAAQKTYKSNKYKSRKAAGLCVNCGRRKAESGVMCNECRLKRNRKSREKYRQQHPDPRSLFRQTGCYFCGAARIPGKKVCARHLEICRQNAQNARLSENADKAREILKRKFYNGV